MSLIVEDGTGLATAESYASVAEADAYFSARGNVDWEAVDDKEAALRKATDYMTQRYRGRWLGQRATTPQALDWPRTSVPFDGLTAYYPSTSVPKEVKNAAAELALRSNAADLSADLERETVSETVDDISVTYAKGTSRQVSYTVVDGWLKPLLHSSTSIRIERS